MLLSKNTGKIESFFGAANYAFCVNIIKTKTYNPRERLFKT